MLGSPAQSPRFPSPARPRFSQEASLLSVAAPPNPNREVAGDTIIFRDTQISSRAVYQCNTSNEHGYLLANAFVSVLGACPVPPRPCSAASPGDHVMRGLMFLSGDPPGWRREAWRLDMRCVGRREGLKPTEPVCRQSAFPAGSQPRSLPPWCHPAGLSRLLGVSMLTVLGSQRVAERKGS